MNTKKYFKNVLFVAAVAIISLSFSSKSALALSWGGTVDTSGNLSLTAGSSTSAMCAATGNCGSGYGGWMSSFTSNPYGLPTGGDGGILGIFQNILFWLLALFAIFGIIGFVISGIFYLIAAGEESTMEKGKEGMKWSIIGVIVGLSGYVIMKAVLSLLSGTSSSF